MVRGVAFGVLITSGFGFLWVNWAASLFGTTYPGACCAAAGAVALFLAGCALLALRRNSVDTRSPEERRRVSRIFGWTNAGQWTVILVAGQILFRTHHVEWFPWCVSLVVGLHFFPLASIFGRRMFLVGASTLAVDALALGWRGTERAGIAALGTGCVLFLFGLLAVLLLLRGMRPQMA